jgi:hypothetical protein
MRTAQEILDGHRAFIQEKSKLYKVVRVEDIDTWSREYMEGVIREAKIEGLVMASKTCDKLLSSAGVTQCYDSIMVLIGTL